MNKFHILIFYLYNSSALSIKPFNKKDFNS